MKDLRRLEEECRAELLAIGIQCGRVRRLTANTRAKSRFGQCRKVAEGVFDIDISARLLADDVDELPVKTTMLHELLHTVEGCLGHRGKWKALALLVGKHYPQYQIKRTASYEEKGIPKERPRQVEAAGRNGYRYRIVCSGCGVCGYRQRASRLIQNPEDFRCGRCGGKLVVERLQKKV